MGPSHETIELADAYLAHARWWLPASPRGCVLYLHGIESHGGWFESSAARLAEAGFAVLLPDRRGSGQNHLERGHARSAGQLLQDVKLQARLLLDRTGFQRAHLLGVSWGGKLAAAAMVRWPALFGSLTLVTPGLFARVHLPGRDRLRVIWSALMA
ncbi:MAG: alpha/beta hydrolase, partial [Phycisphaerae bacterium]